MNEENQISYYSIIPATIRYDNKLKSAEKLLYGEITSLANKMGYCFASNKYFANLYGISENCVKRLIEDLDSKKYISVCFSDNHMQISLNAAESANAHCPNIL